MLEWGRDVLWWYMAGCTLAYLLFVGLAVKGEKWRGSSWMLALGPLALALLMASLLRVRVSWAG